MATFTLSDGHSTISITHTNDDVNIGEAPWINAFLKASSSAHDRLHCDGFSFKLIASKWRFKVDLPGVKKFTTDHDLSNSDFIIIIDGNVKDLKISDVEAYQAVRIRCVDMVMNHSVTDIEVTYTS